MNVKRTWGQAKQMRVAMASTEYRARRIAADAQEPGTRAAELHEWMATNALRRLNRAQYNVPYVPAPLPH